MSHLKFLRLCDIKFARFCYSELEARWQSSLGNIRRYGVMTQYNCGGTAKAIDHNQAHFAGGAVATMNEVSRVGMPVWPNDCIDLSNLKL